MNASSNANTLIGYKMSYYRSMYGIDICNADLNYCLLRAKPLCLTPDQHAQENSVYELSLAKSNRIIIDEFNPGEITETIIAISLLIFCLYKYIYCSMQTIMCMNFNK